MNWVDVVTLAVMVIGFTVIGLIKGMPMHLLNRNLENLKGELQKDIDKLRISGENIHPLKIEEYVEFSKTYMKLMNLGKVTDEKENIALQKEVFEGMSRFGFSILFFGDDETVKKYVEVRKYSTLKPEEIGENEKAKLILLMSELVVIMRKDLGHEKSSVTIDDFLTITLNNWGDSKAEFTKKASEAIKL